MANENWYTLNGTRAYPLDDAATHVDDAGLHLPPDLLVDCHLRFPSTAGRYAFLGGITVTPRVVTLVFLGAPTPESAGDFTPLAAVNLRQPVSSFRHYPLEAMLPGVAGFVALGDVGEAFAGRFSSPAQSLITPRCARAYAPLPIPSIRKSGRTTGLTDLVRLVAGSDLEITAETVEINGLDRPSLVFRLVQGAAGRDILAEYAGPCGGRPESHTCNGDGIETINGEYPTCDNNFYIIFPGMTSGRLADCDGLGAGGADRGGTVIDLDMGLDEVCGARETVQRFAGEDLCESSSSAAFDMLSFFDAGPVIELPELAARPQKSLFRTGLQLIPPALPFETDFRRGLELLTTKSGVFETHTGITGCTTTAAGQRNLTIWRAPQPGGSLNKRVAATLSCSAATVRRNGGIVINYREKTGKPEYFWVAVNISRQKFQLWRISGLSASVMHEIDLLGTRRSVKLGDEVRVTVETREHPQDDLQTLISCKIDRPDAANWPAATFQVATKRFGPADGLFGLSSDRSWCRFSSFSVEELAE